MQNGSKCLYMTEKQFVRFMQKTEDWSEYQCACEWHRRKNDPTQRTDEQGRLLIKVEDFVITFNERTQKEVTQWGLKDKKNPTDADITDFENMMGTDHRGFEDSSWDGVAGFQTKGFDGLARNKFTRSTEADQPPSPGPISPSKAQSPPSSSSPGPQPSGGSAVQPQGPQGALVSPQHTRPATRQPEEPPSKKHRKEKEFDKHGALTGLLPDVNDMIDKTRAKITENIERSNTLIQSARESKFASLLMSGLELLQNRVSCLEALLDTPENFAEFKESKSEYLSEVAEPCASFQRMTTFARLQQRGQS